MAKKKSDQLSIKLMETPPPDLAMLESEAQQLLGEWRTWHRRKPELKKRLGELFSVIRRTKRAQGIEGEGWMKYVQHTFGCSYKTAERLANDFESGKSYKPDSEDLAPPEPLSLDAHDIAELDTRTAGLESQLLQTQDDEEAARLQSEIAELNDEKEAAVSQLAARQVRASQSNWPQPEDRFWTVELQDDEPPRIIGHVCQERLDASNRVRDQKGDGYDLKDCHKGLGAAKLWLKQEVKGQLDEVKAALERLRKRQKKLAEQIKDGEKELAAWQQLTEATPVVEPLAAESEAERTR